MAIDEYLVAMQQRSFHLRLTPWRRRVIDAALDELLSLPAPERQARMDAITARCPRVSRVLVRLLEASLTPTRFLKTLMGEIERVVEDMGESETVSLPAGTRLGPWRIIEPAGQGGMGTVYRAERADEAFDMVVAIKLIRHNRADFNQRLELERKLLARLDHPNIARLIDGGRTPGGEAYLVMEWVEGHDLDVIERSEVSSRDEWLIRFGQITDAVAHAHQRQVVHGDIKPANVRVMDDGRLRLLDFGIAQLLAEQGPPEQQRLRAVTPAFSPPEQMAGEAPSTLADVWSLGALLFWMLTGERPGRMDPSRVRARLEASEERGRELAAIVLKACAETPEARYASVPELASDIQRFRQRRPVHAVPWTRRYLVARFVGRHRLSVAATAAGLVMLCAALVGALWQARIATLERDRAQVEVEKTRQVSEFLIELFDHADPATARGQDVLARDLVEQGVLRIDALADAPEVQGELFQVLARVHRSLGDYEAAESLARRSLAALEDDGQTLERARVLNLIGTIQTAAGRADSAERYHRQALDLLATGDSMDRLILLADWGGALSRTGGRHAEALPALDEAMALARRLEYSGVHLDKLHQNAGVALFHLGRYREAQERFELAVTGKRERLGDDHPDTLAAMSNLAGSHALLADFDTAERIYHEILDIQRRIMGAGHPQVGNTLHAIGSMHWRKREVEEAGHWWQQALEVNLAALGNDHPEVATTRNALALVAREQGDLDRAEALYLQALEAFEAAYPEGHIRIPMVVSNLAGIHSSRGDLDRAIELNFQAKAMQIELVGEIHDHVAHTRRNIAGLNLNNGNPEAALEWARKAEATYMSVFDDTEHPGYQATQQLLERIDQALSD
jgi:eukaryotic-like serine/threonine-protein kinase